MRDVTMKQLTIRFIPYIAWILLISTAPFTQTMGSLKHDQTSNIHIMIEKSSAAVIHIAAHQPIYANTQTHRGYSKFGSGVIVDAKKGLILTNAHVVNGSKNITVTLKDGRRKLAKLLGRDLKTDIAVLQIHANHLTAIPIADSSQVQIGDWVAAIGSPFGLNQTVTSGMVSALHRYIGLEGDEDFIQTDASINPGNSGGALINRKGELIGINTAIIGPSGSKGGSVGIGLAIPSRLAKAIMDQFVQYGNIKRGQLGAHIQSLTADLSAAFHHHGKKGVLITRIEPHSSAAKAGMLAEDIILSINHQPIINTNQLSATISSIRAGKTVPASILRAGKIKTLPVKILPQNKHQNIKSPNYLLAGVDFQESKQFNTQEGYISGITIFGLKRNSAAWLGGLRPGDIILSANQTPTDRIDHLLLIARSATSLLLKIYRKGNIIFVVLSQ